MSFKDAGRWLVTTAVGVMLAAAPATALAAQSNGFGVGNRASNNRAVPATLETTNNSQMSKYKKIDDDDDGGDWDFGFGFGVGPWWGGWYGPPYWGWGPSQYYYYPVPQHKHKKGQVKIETSRKNAKVYINGGYAGRVKQEHKFKLSPGRYEVDIRTANGQNYNTNVYVL